MGLREFVIKENIGLPYEENPHFEQNESNPTEVLGFLLSPSVNFRGFV